MSIDVSCFWFQQHILRAALEQIVKHQETKSIYFSFYYITIHCTIMEVVDIFFKLYSDNTVTHQCLSVEKCCLHHKINGPLCFPCFFLLFFFIPPSVGNCNKIMKFHSSLLWE